MIARSVAEVLEAVGRGEKIDALDREGRTALFYAAQEGRCDVVRELFRLGANANARDKSLETPLHFAARAFQLDAAEMLLKNGAAVDAADIHGNTPLARAVYDSRGRGEMISILLSHGADKGLKNKYGVSSEDLARSIANYNVAVFLK